MLSRRRLIYLLVFIISLLLFLNVALKITENKQEQKIEKQISISIAEKGFFEVLNYFGLENDWIEKRRLNKALNDSIDYFYQVSVPENVSVPEIMTNLQVKFSKFPTLLTSNEQNPKGNSLLTLMTSQKDVKLKARLVYKSDIIRKEKNIAFLIYNCENASENDLNLLIKLPYKFGCILPLEEDSQIIAEQLKKEGIEYFIQLKSDSDHLDFELEEDIGLEKITSNVKSIVSYFNSPKYFLTDSKNSNLNLNVKSFVKDILQKKGRKLVSVDNITLLKGKNREDLKSILEFHLRNTSYDKKNIFRISISDWLILQDEINSYIRSGNTIYSPSKYWN